MFLVPKHKSQTLEYLAPKMVLARREFLSTSHENKHLAVMGGVPFDGTVPKVYPRKTLAEF